MPNGEYDQFPEDIRPYMVRHGVTKAARSSCRRCLPPVTLGAALLLPGRVQRLPFHMPNTALRWVLWAWPAQRTLLSKPHPCHCPTPATALLPRSPNLPALPALPLPLPLPPAVPALHSGPPQLPGPVLCHAGGASHPVAAHQGGRGQRRERCYSCKCCAAFAVLSSLAALSSTACWRLHGEWGVVGGIMRGLVWVLTAYGIQAG